MSASGVPLRARPVRTLSALWNFTRPHTLIGSAVCIPAIHLFAAPVGVALPLGPLAASVFLSLIPSLLINVYIVGLNQVMDIEADRINKPDLPLAKGEFTRAQGIGISVTCLAVGLAVGCLLPPPFGTVPLRATLLGSTVLGTAYSLPPFRLKRFPLMASLCITTVRGALVNWGFFAHASRAVYHTSRLSEGPATADLRCLAATSFYVLFGIVIALLKDIPDVAGDRAVGTTTYSTRFGRERIFAIATGTLQFAFMAIGLALIASGAHRAARGVAVSLWLRRALGGSLALACSWTVRTVKAGVRVDVPFEVYKFYMKCWALFYASYAALPLAR